MQISKVVTLATVFTLTIFSTVLFFSCKKKAIKYNDSTLIRPCENVICLNGGTCKDGLCYCPVGYEGLKCATKWSEKFLGYYKASDECYTGTNNFYFVNITPILEYANKMTIHNLGTACPGTLLEAVINPEKTTFHIPSQTTCNNIYISGNGNINGDYINIYLEQRDSTNHTSNNCSIILDRQ